MAKCHHLAVVAFCHKIASPKFSSGKVPQILFMALCHRHQISHQERDLHLKNPLQRHRKSGAMVFRGILP